MTEVVKEPLIVAVSGGVDSVVLLDILKRTKCSIVVAHVNHGIRSDSDEDEAFVKELAASYKVPFVSTRLRLTPSASEDMARQARYSWLEKVKAEYGAQVIVTAHHEDDVLETIIINISRGTGWRGLCSLRSTPLRYRPLIKMNKAGIIAYALEHNITWREDSTNESLKYLRNRVRHQVIPRMSAVQRRALLELNTSQLVLRESIDEELNKRYEMYNDEAALLRYPLIMLPESISFELLKTWLGESLKTERLRDLLVFSKTAKHGAKWSLDGTRFIKAEIDRLIVLAPRD